MCPVPQVVPSGSFAEALRLFERFRQESDLEAARQCIDIYNSLLADSNDDFQAHNADFPALPSESYDANRPLRSQIRYHVLIQLARTLHELYLYAGDAHNLESACIRGAEALEMCRAKNTICPTVWAFYADILRSDFEATSNNEQLSMAEMLCRESISLCTAGHPLSATIYHTLGQIARRRFDRSGDESFIDEAVNLQRLGLERLPETESYIRHRHLLRLGEILAHNSFHRGHQDKYDVLSIMSEAFQLCPPAHVDRWIVRLGIMGQLLVEYSRSGKLEFVNKALELGRQAQSIGRSPNATKQALFLSRMAYGLRIRHEVARTNEEDLEESVRLHREALQTCFPGFANYWAYRYDLATILVLQFRSDGDVGHLEEASQLYHKASESMSKEHSGRPLILSGFAQCLGLRFMETRDISELNQAINLDEEAVAAWHPSALNRVDTTLQMTTHLCLRFEILHGNEDLEKAITVAEELLRSLPDGNINRLEAINILARARLLHSIDKNDLGDIDLTIEQLLSTKVDLLRSKLGPESLRTLAACHLVKFRQSSAVNHALLARDAIHEVLEIVTENHYERFQCLIDAAEIYMERGTPYYNIDFTLKYLSDALGNTHRDVRSKIQGTKRVVDRLEIEYHNLFTTTSSTSLKLLDVIGNAVLLLPRIAFFGVRPYPRLQSLQAGQSIAMTGASHALNLSFPEKALEIMEQGRAIFWTHSLRLRSPFDEIPDVLRDKLVGLARRLEKVTSASESFTDQQHVEREIAQRRKESEEFNLLVGEVRRLSGLDRFMLPDEYSTLVKVAEKGPVVVLVSSSLACHAVVLEPSGKTTSIPLEAITDNLIVKSASVWRSTVIESRSAMRDGRKLIKSKKHPNSAYLQAEQILRLLWVNVVWPVIETLGVKVCFSISCLKYEFSHV
jgi:tetratricopeptide (TPR) repeat protein